MNHLIRFFARHSLCILILYIILSACCFPVCASPENTASQRVVRVAYYPYKNFLEGDSDKQIKSGYAYEYLQYLAYKLGWKYEYVYGSREELYQRFLKGDIDLMPGIIKGTADIKVQTPRYHMGTVRYWMYKLFSNASLQKDNIASFAGKKIGIQRNTIAFECLENWAKRKKADIRIIAYEGVQELYNAILAGDVDAIVETHDKILHHTVDIIPLEKMEEYPCYLGISPEKTDLLNDINNAISQNEAQHTYLLYQLHARYFMPVTLADMFFSEQERIWLQTHHYIRVGYVNKYLPYSDTKNGKVNGIVQDTVPELFSVLNIQSPPDISYIGYDNVQKMIEDLRENKIDLAFPISGGLWYAEQNGIYQSEKLITAGMNLVYRDVYSPEKTRRIAVNQQNAMQYYYTINNFPNAEIIWKRNIEECLNAVLSKEADSTIVNGLRTAGLLFNAQYKTLKNIILKMPDDRCFGISRNHPELLRIVNQGINSMDPGFSILASYRYIKDLSQYTIRDFIRENFILAVLIFVSITITILFFCIAWIISLKKNVQKDMEHARELSAALEDTKRAELAKSEFLSRISHDIRTPLNGIIGLLDMGDRHPDDIPLLAANRYKAQRAAHHLLDLVNDVLQLSKIENSTFQMVNEPFNLRELIRNVLNIIEIRAVSEGLTLCSDDPASISFPHVCGSPLYIRQILLNILSNAIKYNKPGGSLNFSFSTVADDQSDLRLQCVISDTGIGINPDFLQHIFEPFSQERYDTAGTDYRGVGLGMSIVKSLLDKMEGTIQVESELNVGSTFTISIPLRKKEESDIVRPSRKAPDLGKMHILLVEDNPLNMEIAQSLLTDFGASVTCAQNGRLALKTFSGSPENTFDLILLDIMMPQMNGYETAKAIRSLSRSDACSIPIIVMSANIFETDVEKSLKAGINAYLSKPLKIDLLMETLAKYSRKA
ncbi:MAG: transporter substrate-binding domain-containing protein [Desulfovibrionaceae bacterium]|nr:transporter substrate-binding domain-containing protein [Desulfovibrionaceae bacterium]